MTKNQIVLNFRSISSKIHLLAWKIRITFSTFPLSSTTHSLQQQQQQQRINQNQQQQQFRRQQQQQLKFRSRRLTGSRRPRQRVDRRSQSRSRILSLFLHRREKDSWKSQFRDQWDLQQPQKSVRVIYLRQNSFHLNFVLVF